MNTTTQALRLLLSALLISLPLSVSWPKLSTTNIKESEELALEETELTESIEEEELYPEYFGEPFAEINNNLPFFTEEEKNSLEPFEKFCELDDLGRCGVAYANVCPELLPDETRGPIGSYQPSGWQTVKYNNLIDGNYLYNRCHLIGYQLTGENSNELNLITGTRYLNVTGMLAFEDRVTSYVEQSGNHVLYRVTPVFEGDNLVATGVQMEGWSVEDQGEGICFNVFFYNVQPGIIIDYATGDSSVDPEYLQQNESVVAANLPGTGEKNVPNEVAAEGVLVSFPTNENQRCEFVLNTNRHKIHLPGCSSVDQMADHNKREFTGTIGELREDGYSPCQRCLSIFPK